MRYNLGLEIGSVVAKSRLDCLDVGEKLAGILRRYVRVKRWKCRDNAAGAGLDGGEPSVWC